MPVKLKSPDKSESAIKKTLKLKPYKKSISKRNNLSQLSEDIISNVGVGIYIVQHGKFVLANHLYQKLTGYSVSEIIGHNSLDHVHPDDKAMVRTKAIKSLKGESHGYEYRFIKKSGEEMWILEMITPIAYKGVRAALGSFMDITEHKRMEDELRQNEEKYRTILENIEDGYAEMDLHGNFIFFNEVLCKIQGYPRNELIKLNYRDLMDEENAKKIFARYNKVFTTGKSEKEVQYEIITKSGLRRYLETSITPMKDASGRIFAFRGIVRDRTESGQAEEALRRSEERYRTIIENIEDGYFEVDLAGTFTFVNDSLCRDVGTPREQLLGKNNRAYTSEEEAKKLYKFFSGIYITGEPVKGFAFEYKRRDGTMAFNELTASLMRDSEGKPTGFRGISRDVTERKQMEEALRDNEKRFRELSIVDELTQLYNSRHFYFQLKIELDRSNRYEHPLTLLLLDLDNFKAFNDAYGHVEGDQVLRRLGQILKRCVRNTDFAYRYGGEEFTILLPMTTSAAGTVIAERIRAELKKESFSPEAGKDVHITVSIGLAQFKLHEDMKDFVCRVDQLMYQAKKNGKDRVCFES